MDKKMLRQIPRPETKPEYIELAKKKELAQWLFRVTDEKGILQIVAWDANELRNGKAFARYRLFFDLDDYITQDLTQDKTKWLTGKLYNILTFGWYGIKVSLVEYVDDESRLEMERRFPPATRSWNPDGVKSSLYSIDDWQDGILKERLKAKHERELRHTNLMMELVPDLPDDFEEWIHDYGMRSRRYLVYDGKSQRMREAFCTECGRHMTIDSKKVRLRTGEWGECPCCGSPVIMKTIRRWHDKEFATNTVCIPQKIEDGRLLFRGFNVTYQFKKTEFPQLHIEKRQTVNELLRVFINDRNWEGYEYTEYKMSRNVCWCPDTGRNELSKFIIRRDGLRQLLAGTIYQYSGLEVLQEKCEFQHLQIFKYLQAYEICNELEMIVKAGMTKFAKDLIDEVMWWHRKTPDSIKTLHTMSKDQINTLRRLNGGTHMMDLLKEIELCRGTMSDEDLKAFAETFGESTQIYRRIRLKGVSVPKFTRYVQKQVGRSGKDIIARKNIIHDWEDYLGWCEKLHYNMNDPYVLMPPDFKKAHDRVLKELEAAKDALIREQEKMFDEMLKAERQSLSDFGPLYARTKKYMIVVPTSVEDLRNEGKTLHHCVATYADKVAKKQTMILFVRKVETPQVPFFTMEWKDNHVVQCRGSHNCDMPDDVKAFVNAFEKKMKAAEEKKRKARAS